jgi:ribonucleotide monophosphatase NagD (HAD superfamily)
MANRIFYNEEGFVEVKIEDDQTYMSFENLLPTAIDLLDKLQKEGKKRFGLIDVTNQHSFTPDSNRAAMNILESLNYEKLAIYGGGTVLRDVTKAIILAMGKNENTKVFQEREEALAWLLSV